MARKRIGEILTQAGVLDSAGLRAALTEQRRWGGPLGRILVDMKLVSEDALVRALSQQLNFPVVNIDKVRIPAEVLELVSGDLAEQHGIIPFNLEGKFLDVAMSDPTNLGIIDELRIRTQLNVRPYLAGPKAIERALARCYGRGIGLMNMGLGGQSDSEIPIVEDGLDLDASRTGVKAGGAELGASQRRANLMELTSGKKVGDEREAEIRSLQERIQRLEALITRDEDVLRKILGLLVDKGIATRDEILDRIK
jgi:type IV pilus assembly protein PilB